MALLAAAPDLGCGVTLLGRRPLGMGSSWLLPLTSDVGNTSQPRLVRRPQPPAAKTQQWPQDWKRSVFIPIPKKGNAKECSNYRTIALISHASKVMLKIPQGRLQQYVNCKLADVQAGFRKGRGTRDQIANIHWIMEKAREFQKNISWLLY